MTPEQLAKLFHDTYERLAPRFNYQTRPDSAKPWASVPEANRLLMVATCAEVLTALPAPAWLPIESCPQDGFFIVHEDGAMRMMFRVRGEWQATALALDKIHGDPDHTIKVRETGVYNPTHWMPLPPAPKGTP